MNEAKYNKCSNPILVNIHDLKAMLGCGRATAVVSVGRRRLYHVEKISNYCKKKCNTQGKI